MSGTFLEVWGYCSGTASIPSSVFSTVTPNDRIQRLKLTLFFWFVCFSVQRQKRKKKKSGSLTEEGVSQGNGLRGERRVEAVAISGDNC